MVDPPALRALTLVAQTGSVAGAADSLGLTPSAVSQQLKRLESSLGVPLLSRAGRGVVLTAAAESLCAAAPDVFASLERATQAALAQAAEPTGTVRVAAFSTAIRGLLAPALPALAARHPALRVTLDEADPEQAAAALAAGSVDLAVLHDSAALPAWSAAPVRRALRTEQLAVDVGDVIVRADHPLARRAGSVTGGAGVTAAELRGDVWVTSPPGTACHDWFQRLFARAARPEVHHRIDDFSTQLAVVAAGGGIALIPRLARPPLPDGLVALAVTPAPTRIVECAWRASSDDSPALQAVRAALAAVADAA